MLFFDEGKQRKGCQVLLPLWTSVNDAPFPTEKTSKIARNLPKHLRYSRQKMNTLNKKTAKHPTKKAPLKNKNNSSPLKKQQFFFEKRSKSTTSIHWIQGPLTPLWRLFWHQVLCLQRICNERHETWRSNHSSWEGHGSGCFWWLVLGGVLGDSKGRGGGTLKIRKKEKKRAWFIWQWLIDG